MRSITISLITLFCISSIGILPTFANSMESQPVIYDPTEYNSVQTIADSVTNTTLQAALKEESVKSDNSTVREATSNAANNVSGNGPTYVYTTEKVPGADCVCYIGGTEDGGEARCESVVTRQYKCAVGSGLQGFEKIFRSITGYLVKISILLGVLAIVMFGIGWALLGGDEENTKKLKKYAVNLLVGLTILFLFSYILGFLAPWIFHS